MRAQSVFGDGNFLMLHRAAFSITDNIAEAVLLNELASTQQLHDRTCVQSGHASDSFTRTAEQLRNRCHLGPKEFDNAKKRLLAKGFIAVSVRLVNSQNHAFYRVEWDRITQALELSEEQESSGGASPRKGGYPPTETGPPPHRNGGTQQERTFPRTEPISSAREGAVVNGSRKPKRNGEARYSAAARDIVAGFGDAYRQQFGVPYGRTLRDLQAAESLAGIGAGAATVAEVARSGWTSGKFWGPKMTSVVMLMQRWNEVRAEIAQERPANGADVWDEIEAATQREMAVTNERTA